VSRNDTDDKQRANWPAGRLPCAENGNPRAIGLFADVINTPATWHE
jgi:hypothetical protein